MTLGEQLYNVKAEVEGALSSESAQFAQPPPSKVFYTLEPPVDFSKTQLDLQQQHQDQHQHQHMTTPTAVAPASTLPTTSEPDFSHNHLAPPSPPSAPKMESSTTTVAGSRDPTIKQPPSDNSSTHSNRPVTDGENMEKMQSHSSGYISNGAEADKEAAAKGEHSDDDVEGVDESGLLHGLKLYLVFLSLMLTVFSIVATAIPVIVSDFRAFDEVSWVITAYFLTQCGLILLVGQMLTIIKAKWVLLSAIFFFELGSLLCAIAQNMPVLIFARAVQGIGAAGMFVSLLAVIVTITTLKQRPAFMAAFGFVFVISSVVGPLLGGVFTERVSWRWCFWINLPIGGIAAAAVVFLLPARDPARHHKGYTGWKAVGKMDFIGAILSLAFVTCLLLALQWGGNNYPWGNWRIILLFVLGVVLVVAFFAWQWKRNQSALMPLSLLKNRTQLASMGAMFMLMIGMLGGTYQLPLYYQATRGRTPEQSGIDIIPFMLAVCIGIFISGGFVTKMGRYYPWLVIGPPITAVGFGLFYTVDSSTPNPRLIGYQILAGVGIGLTFQNPLVAIQVEYNERPSLIPQANGVVSFFQLTGAALGIGVVNTVQSIFLNSELLKHASSVPFEVVRQSPTVIYTLPEEVRPAIIEAYTKAITESFIPIIVATGLGWISCLFIKNKSTLGKMVEGGIA